MTMTTDTTIDLRALEPLRRCEAVEFGRVEYRRLVDLLEDLSPEEWTRDTDCEGWTVRHVAGHLAGAMTSASSLRRQIAEQRQVIRRAKRTGEAEVDAMTAIQIEANADLGQRDLVERMGSLVDAAADGRARMPGPIARAIRFRVVMNTIDERWSLDHLLGPILTRDTWLHRVVDISRAIDHPPLIDADHDGRIVADVAAEWARRHGRDVTLTLTGPAGGRYVAGEAGPELEIDAVDFCRIVSRRAAATHPLFETEVPF